MALTVGRVGEFGLIERIRKHLKPGRHVICGSGDDAAVYAGGRRACQLLAIDTIVEGVDFKLREAPPELIGRKAVAINLSDIAAMGGVPRTAVMSVVMPKRMPLRWFDRMISGAQKIAAAYQLSLVGGDLSSGRDVVCTVAVTGEARKGKIVYRQGARAGDLIAVTGELGGSILGKHLRFLPRVEEGQFLAGYGVSSMIDISDGLVQDLNHLADASRLGYELDREAVPVSRAAKRLALRDRVSPLGHALGDGEDFELLFTVSPVKFLKLKRAWEKCFRVSLTPIGRMAANKTSRLSTKGKQGFRHF